MKLYTYLVTGCVGVAMLCSTISWAGEHEEKERKSAGPSMSMRDKVKYLGVMGKAPYDFTTKEMAGVNLSGTAKEKTDLDGSMFSTTRSGAKNLQGIQLRYVTAVKASFQKADLRGADLRFSNFDGAFFVDAKFDATTRFEGSTFNKALFVKTQFGDAKLAGAKSFNGAIFIGNDLSNRSMDGMYFEGATFNNVNLTKTTFKKTYLTGAKFIQSKPGPLMFNGTDFSGADMSSVVIQGEFQHEVDGGGKQWINMYDVKFAGADMAEASLEKLYVENGYGQPPSDFKKLLAKGSHWSNCSLFGDFSGAVLNGATLDNMTISGKAGQISFNKAQFSGDSTTFIQVELWGGQFNGAQFHANTYINDCKLLGAEFKGAVFNKGVRFSNTDLANSDFATTTFEGSVNVENCKNVPEKLVKLSSLSMVSSMSPSMSSSSVSPSRDLPWDRYVAVKPQELIAGITLPATKKYLKRQLTLADLKFTPEEEKVIQALMDEVGGYLDDAKWLASYDQVREDLNRRSRSSIDADDIDPRPQIIKNFKKENFEKYKDDVAVRLNEMATRMQGKMLGLQYR